MPGADERQIIRDAMTRLLNGAPIRSNGSLTILSLAHEAGVKRHLLTHRHQDLRDEFYARVKAQGKVPQSELLLRKELHSAQERVEQLRLQNELLSEEHASLRRVNSLLALEKAAAEELLAADDTGTVTRIFRGRRRRGSFDD